MSDPRQHYTGKPEGYFAGARREFIDDLPVNPVARLLEIGCARGGTAAYALQTAKCGWCAGVELCEGPAVEARSRLQCVLVGDIESMELPFPAGEFDILILSEVLEHVRDPWAVLRRLRPLLRSGARVRAGSPNVAYHRVLRMMLAGRWDYADMGIMDRTHLRWFTPQSYRELFESCGYGVDFVGPATPLPFKLRMLGRASFGRLTHLLHGQIRLNATRP